MTTKFQAKRGNRQDDYLHTHGSQVIVLSVTSFLADPFCRKLCQELT